MFTISIDFGDEYIAIKRQLGKLLIINYLERSRRIHSAYMSQEIRVDSMLPAMMSMACNNLFVYDPTSETNQLAS